MQVPITKKRVLDFWTLTSDPAAYRRHVDQGGEHWEARISELAGSKAKKSTSQTKHVGLWEAMGRACQLHEVQYRRGFAEVDPETDEVVLDTGNYLESLRCDNKVARVIAYRNYLTHILRNHEVRAYSATNPR